MAHIDLTDICQRVLQMSDNDKCLPQNAFRPDVYRIDGFNVKKRDINGSNLQFKYIILIRW